MMYADRDAKNFTCPIASHANRKRIPCIGSACAWWTWHAGPGVSASEYTTTTTEPVGGCGLLPPPSAQHWLIALDRQPPRNSILAGYGGEPFDVSKLNRAGDSPADPAPEF